MPSDVSHVRQIKVVSYARWAREGRCSFEKTRRRLLDMLDATLEILDQDPEYAFFTLEGGGILIEDYLELRPEQRVRVAQLVQSGRLILGPCFTAMEDLSVGHEALIRNLQFGRRALECLGGQPGTVFCAPSFRGATGQLPQLLDDFGFRYVMFGRGPARDDGDTCWIWQAPDGTQLLAGEFLMDAGKDGVPRLRGALAAGGPFDKRYEWGEYDEAPVRPADGLSGEEASFELMRPLRHYDRTQLEAAIDALPASGGSLSATATVLALNGYGRAAAHPDEPEMIRDARELLGERGTIEACDLESFWTALEQELDRDTLSVVIGECCRELGEDARGRLSDGLSLRTDLKQRDFSVTAALTQCAEPLACLAGSCGAGLPLRYLERGWRYLLSCHTNGLAAGCASDAVCLDRAYRYRKAVDIADIVSRDAMAHIAARLSPGEQPESVLQLIVFNPLPYARSGVVAVDLALPRVYEAQAAELVAKDDPDVVRQPIEARRSRPCVNSLHDVPRSMPANRVRFYAYLSGLPGLGYRTYRVNPEAEALPVGETLVTGPTGMANAFLAVNVNADGTVNLTCKDTGRAFYGLNYLRDQGEAGTALRHRPPTYDAVTTSLGAPARISVTTSGPVVAEITAEYALSVPLETLGGSRRSGQRVELSVRAAYRLERESRALNVALTVDNRARDHWLRACFPSDICTDVVHADTHFDVLARPIVASDSGVARAGGVCPLQTFVDLSDDTDGLAVLPRGLHEYEVFDDARRTLALTLLRGCRSSRERTPATQADAGPQCAGVQTFDYAIYPHAGHWADARLLTRTACINAPLRAIQVGRGQGELPLSSSFLTLTNAVLHVTAVKPSDDGTGMVLRLFNATDTLQQTELIFGRPVRQVHQCTMDEESGEALPVTSGGVCISLHIPPRKIVSLRAAFDNEAL